MRRIKKIKVSNYFRRFIISFMFVLFLPIVCFIFVFQNNFSMIYRDNILKQVQSSLDMSGLAFDRDIENLQIYIDYLVNEDVLTEAIGKKEMEIGDIKKTLSGVMLAYPFLSDVCYFYKETPECVYTTGGTYSTYYFSMLKSGMEDSEQFLELLQSVKKNEWMTWKNGLQYVIRDRKDSIWIFIFDTAELKSILHSEGYLTDLLDAEGEVLYALEKLNGEGLYELEYVSQKNIFRIVRKIEEEVLFFEFDIWQRNFFIFIIILMLVGTSLVVILTYYNENPVKQLLKYSREKVQDMPDDLDGFEAFQYAMKSIEEQASIKEEKQGRNNMLLKLIYGHDCDSESFRKEMDRWDLFEDKSYYRVIMLTNIGERVMDFSKINLWMEMQDKKEYEFRMTELLREDAAVMIVGMADPAEERLERKLQQMTISVSNNFEDEICLFVGGNCTKLSDIHLSYVQAYACMQKKSEEKIERVIFYNNGRGNKKYQYPKVELENLYEALINVEMDTVVFITDMLVKFINDLGGNRFGRLSLYYDVMNTYYRALKKLEKNQEFERIELDFLILDESIAADKMIYHIRDQYFLYIEKERENADDSEEELELVQVAEAQTKVRKVRGVGKSMDNETLIANVLKFIDDNMEFGELSVSMVADYFGMSISHMSHKFKEQFEENISDYITKKVLAYSCKLLLETELSVNEISSRVGYSHPVSFRRKFKQFYGMTPGEYRMGKQDKD